VSSCLLEFESVAMRFGPRIVLTGVSFRLGEGEIVGVIGNNGAGKTTLLRLVAGIYRPTTGTIRRFGSDFIGRGWKQRIGALIEQPGHYDELTVRENLEFTYGFYARDRRACSEAIDERLSLFGLEPVEMEHAGQLSAGFRQRLSLARAFHPEARLVLLDEPFECLDPTMRHELKNVLNEMRPRGMSMLVSTHALSDVQNLCDRILVVADHRIHAFGSFDGIRRFVEQPSGDLDAVYATLIRSLEGHQ